MIGAQSEVEGLYHLSPPMECASIASLELTHQCLGHPSLNKMRLLVPSFSNFLLLSVSHVNQENILVVLIVNK